PTVGTAATAATNWSWRPAPATWSTRASTWRRPAGSWAWKPNWQPRAPRSASCGAASASRPPTSARKATTHQRGDRPTVTPAVALLVRLPHHLFFAQPEKPERAILADV